MPFTNVSTHSRLKAAAAALLQNRAAYGFNTQPPEGGCSDGWTANYATAVSTHSRLKAAGLSALAQSPEWQFQHTAA